MEEIHGAPLNAMLRTIKAITRIRSRTASLLTNILGPTTDINIEQSRRTAVTESWASQASRKELRVDNVPGASFDSKGHKGNIDIQPDTQDDRLRLFTTLPPFCVGEHPKLRQDGHTECLLTPFMKQMIVSTPGFPAPLIHPPLAHSVRASPTGGLGMFATRALRAGEFILTERALTITPVSIGSYNKDEVVEDLETTVLRSIEKIMDTIFDRMLPENREAYLALHNSHEKDGSGPLFGRNRTNNYGLDICDALEVEYVGVFNQLSRINHSCGGNVLRKFDTPSFALKIFAVRDIAVGEELTIGYCDDMWSTAERQISFAPYGFVCSCPHCLDPESDARRRRAVVESNLNFRDSKVSAWSSDLSLSDDSLVQEVEELLAMMEKEGLQGTVEYSFLLLHLYAVYSVVEIDNSSYSREKHECRLKLFDAWMARGQSEKRLLEFMQGLSLRYKQMHRQRKMLG